MTVACLKAGSKLAHDGGVWTVVSLSGDRATIEDRVAGSTRSVAISHLLSAPGSRLLDAPIVLPRAAVGPLLANLDEAQLRELDDRAAHVLELATGYRSGNAILTGADVRASQRHHAAPRLFARQSPCGRAESSGGQPSATRHAFRDRPMSNVTWSM